MAKRDWTVPLETWPSFQNYASPVGSVFALPLWLPLQALTALGASAASAGVPESNARLMLESCRGNLHLNFNPIPNQDANYQLMVDMGIAIVTQDPAGVPLLGSSFDFNDNRWVNATDWIWLDQIQLVNFADYWAGANVSPPTQWKIPVHTKAKRVCNEGEVAAIIWQVTEANGQVLDPIPTVGFAPRLRTLVNMLDV